MIIDIFFLVRPEIHRHKVFGADTFVSFIVLKLLNVRARDLGPFILASFLVVK